MLKAKIVDGTSLATAVLLNHIPKETESVLLVGRVSKLAFSLCLALSHKAIKVSNELCYSFSLGNALNPVKFLFFFLPFWTLFKFIYSFWVNRVAGRGASQRKIQNFEAKNANWAAKFFGFTSVLSKQGSICFQSPLSFSSLVYLRD